MPVRMSQQQNRLLRMIHDIFGQARLIIRNQCNMIFSRNILCRDDHKFVPGHFVAETDTLDPAPRDLAPDGRSIDDPGHGNVVHVPRRARDLVASFFAGNRHSDAVMLSQLDGLHSLVDEYTAASAGTRVPLLRRKNRLAQTLISLSDTPPLPLHAAVAPGREKPGAGNTVSLSSRGS